MSSKELKQNSVVAGLQLQLPLYIRAAQEGLASYQAAGGLYQPVRDVLIESEDREQVAAGIDQQLRTAGMILDQESVREAVRPVKISKKSEKNDIISSVSPEEMAAVIDCAVGIVTERVNRIRAGEAAPRPLKDGQESPCSGCPPPDACLYDGTLPGCRMEEVDHHRRIGIPRL